MNAMLGTKGIFKQYFCNNLDDNPWIKSLIMHPFCTLNVVFWNLVVLAVSLNAKKSWKFYALNYSQFLIMSQLQKFKM